MTQDGSVVHKHKTRFTQQQQLQPNVKGPIQGDPSSMILANPGRSKQYDLMANPGRSKQHDLGQSGLMVGQPG